MMEKAVERARQLGEARAQSVAEEVRDTVRAELPGQTVEVDGSDLVVTGHGLLRQWLQSADLRFLASRRR
ncbi:hypothetical protein [Sphingomonas sp.]|uniref:hypothetical protein n=1 Tax=Sphingomonas sp. TaxID=28214 RepID=UPI0025EC930C|nr:hypothetical protein [Sphingomonas sp.]MBV9529250.1 hypothetical protein [Sphingomonas sp.]